MYKDDGRKSGAGIVYRRNPAGKFKTVGIAAEPLKREPALMRALHRISDISGPGVGDHCCRFQFRSFVLLLALVIKPSVRGEHCGDQCKMASSRLACDHDLAGIKAVLLRVGVNPAK